MYLSCKLLLIHSNISWRLRFSEVTLVLNTLTAAIFLQQMKMDGFRHKKQSPVSWKGYSMTNTWQKAFHTKTRPDGWSTKRMGPISEKSPAEWERVWTELWWKMQRVLDKQYYKEGFCVFFADMRCDFSAKLGSMTSNMCCFLSFSFAFCYI